MANGLRVISVEQLKKQYALDLARINAHPVKIVHETHMSYVFSDKLTWDVWPNGAVQRDYLTGTTTYRTASKVAPIEYDSDGQDACSEAAWEAREDAKQTAEDALYGN